MKLYYNVNSLDGFLAVWAIASILKFTNHSGVLTVVLFGSIILWSFFNMIKLHAEVKIPHFVCVLDFLCSMFTVYGLFLLISGEKISVSGNDMNVRVYLLNIYSSLMPFYTFYRYTILGKLSKKKIYVWFALFFLIAYFDYQYQLEIAKEKFASALMSGRLEDVVNNGSYSILGLLPMTFLVKNKYVRLGAFVFCTFFIATSFKRGPLVILFFCFAYYFFFSIKEKGFSYLLLFPFLIYAALLFFSNLYMENALFQNRFELTMEGSNSGRDVLTSGILAYYINHSNFLQLFIGHGAYASIKAVGNYAHNDWLELLICQGLMGFMAYLVYWLDIFKYYIKKRKDLTYKTSLGVFIIIYFLSSLFSMSYAEIPIYAMLIFAFIAAKIDMENKGVKILRLSKITKIK
jgi:hypothetical protein